MKLIKRIVSIILISVLLVINITPASAFNRNEHDRYMSDVLFKDFKNVENDVNIKDDIKALEAASYLTIDQYNGNGNNDLLMLNEYGVKSLPSSINEIDYSAGAYHRRATHRGWDAESTGVYNTSDRNRWYSVFFLRNSLYLQCRGFTKLSTIFLTSLQISEENLQIMWLKRMNMRTVSDTDLQNYMKENFNKA